MTKQNNRVRRNGGSKPASPQALNKAATFAVKITEKIRESAAEAGETVEQFMSTAVQHKLNINGRPLHLLLKADDPSKEDIYVNQDGDLFEWNGESEKKPRKYSLRDAFWWWEHKAKKPGASKTANTTLNRLPMCS